MKVPKTLIILFLSSLEYFFYAVNVLAGDVP